jgi:nucleotide-binding universal stress UspA family protein
MTPNATPILIAYDGSDISKAALEQAAELFPGRPAVVATVWEPGLATLSLSGQDAFGAPNIPPDPETVQAVDQAERDHATQVADEGAAMARSLGLEAEPHPVPAELDVADTLIDLARERDAAVVAMGSHGIAGLRSRVFGSVARKLIEHSDRPVLIVRAQKS